MAIKAGIFGDGSNLKDRYIPNKKKLGELVSYWKKLGLRIVLTSGTFDLFHVGHAEYFERAKELGDLLIVGVDSDEKVKARKGPHRPIVPEEERVRILSHVRHVDAIILKHLKDKPNEIIKIVRPDVLVMSKTTNHAKTEMKEKGKYAKKVVILEPQAATSTSARIRLLHTNSADHFAKELVPRLSSLIEKHLASGSKTLARNIATDIPTVMDEIVNSIDGDRKGKKK